MLLDTIKEVQFQNWYRDLVDLYAKNGHQLNPNPDDPEHFYDYRKAFLANSNPSNFHLTSEFKKIGNPRMFLGGVDTQNTPDSLSGYIAKLIGTKPNLNDY